MLSRVGIVGAGLMGRRFAGTVFKDFDVLVYDTNAQALRDLPAAGSLDELADREFIIEAVVEDLRVKQKLFAKLSRINETAILASNSSVMPISQIARDAAGPERAVGTHWWNPPDLIPLVEVVRGERTDDSTMDATMDFLTRLGKLPVRVEKDVPGFVGNRLQHALWREAIALVAEGVCDAETVDLVVRNTIGLRLGRMGPIENADYVGLDLTLAIHEAVLGGLNADPHPSPLLQQLVRDGRLGAKSGRGFLDWPEGSRDFAAKRLYDHVTRQLEQNNEE